VFKRRVPELAVRPIALVFVRSLGASLVAAGVVFALRGGLALVGPLEPGLVGLLVRLTLTGGVGLAVFALLAAVLRIPELPSIVGVMADLLRRPRRA
jgi:hypothetical protein